MKKKILFNGLGNRGWIGGLYYIKNIMFSCLQNENIMERFSLVLLIDPEHADIFDCFKENVNVDIRVYDGNNKIKLALYEMRLIWFGGFNRLACPLVSAVPKDATALSNPA